MPNIREQFGLASSVGPTTSFVGGVELEIEALKNLPAIANWHTTEDGSLRNAGKEFISAPLGLSTLKNDFALFHSILKTGDNPFSERTSIHVHVNCLDLDVEQVKSIVLWYALFEPVFFAMVEPHRRNNIHCVALTETSLPGEGYKRSLPMMVKKWSKYTALNLLPLANYGTIEFRHMQGHNDTKLFDQWLDTINYLWMYGQQNVMSREHMTEVAILKAFDFIFANSNVRNLRSSLFGVINDQMLDVKLSMIGVK